MFNAEKCVIQEVFLFLQNIILQIEVNELTPADKQRGFTESYSGTALVD